MDENDFIKALVTSILGLLPFTVTTLWQWLQKRSKAAKRDAAIDFAERRVAFLSTWLQARELSATSQKISQIKNEVANELDGIKASVDDIMRTTLEEAKKGTEPLAPLMPLLILSRVIGIVVISLPALIVLVTGEVLPSIGAAYFYAEINSLFVGLLFALGICLLLYQGPTLIEKVGGYLGGISAIGMALFPTACEFCSISRDALLHFVFSNLFFLVMGLFPIYWSRRILPSDVSKRQKQRKQLYTICGSLIIACLTFIGVSALLSPPGQLRVVFLLEFIALLFSGVSWLTKGKVIFGEANVTLYA